MKTTLQNSISKILFIALFIVSSITFAQTVSYSAFTSITCPATPVATISPSVTGLTFSQISRGSGVSCATGAGSISGSGFNGSLATNIAANKYYTFTITANSSTSFTLDGLSIVSRVSNITLSPNVSVQYTIGAGSLNVIGSYTPTTSATPYTITPSTPIAVAASEVITIYIIPNGLTASGTTCRVENNTSATVTTATTSTDPVVTTIAATLPSSSTATLNGTINANGTSTNGSFEYGTTIAYGSTIASTPASVSTSIAENIAATPTGLNVNTLYHFRAVGTQGATVVNGNDLSFYTLANVPNAPTVSGATLNSLLVSIPTIDGNPSTTQYAIRVNSSQYVQASGALGGSEVWQTAATWSTIILTGLTDSTVYAIDVKAKNGDNVETAFSLSNTISTLSPLAAPVATAASNITATSFDANWNSVLDATSYQLDVSTSPTFGTVTNLSNLIISEYGEGSTGSKKYIELYNGTGSSVELANYEIWKNSNGSPWNTTTLSLSGSLANGATYVIANNSGDVLGADLYDGFLTFNGDDATGLAYNGGSGSVFTLIDEVGEEGLDPGTAWNVAGINNATKDKILIRKPTVFAGNTNWTASAGTSVSDSEWIVSAGTYSTTSDTTDLGSHTCDNYTPSFVTGYDNLSVSGLTQTVSGLTLGTTYYYRVRAVSATETSANSNVISVTTVNPAYVTQLNPASCGATLPNIYSSIGAVIKAGVDGYRFEVTGPSGVQTIDRTVHYFSLNMLPTYEYGTVYSVRVMVSVGGTFVGYYGPACTVTSPGSLVTPGFGPASVVSPTCGSTLSKIYTTISSNILSGVTGYRFRVTNGAQVQVLDKSTQWFKLSELPLYEYGVAYTIEVAVKTTGTYGSYGTACVVNSPAVPGINQCGLNVNPGQTLSVTPVNYVTNYRFVLNDGTTEQIIDRGIYQWLPVSMITGYSETKPFTVKVSVMTNGVQSNFGAECSINPVALDRLISTSSSIDFNVFAYPNPFATNFKLNVSTSSSDVINVVVYDMVGKMLTNQAINASDINSLEIGNNYSNGMYNVVISQGENTKSIRLIKN